MSHTISDRKRARWAAELDGRKAKAFPGMSAHVRGYRPDEIVEIARKLAGIISEDKIAHLLPETACLCVRALLSLAAKPSYDELLRALSDQITEQERISSQLKGNLTVSEFNTVREKIRAQMAALVRGGYYVAMTVLRDELPSKAQTVNLWDTQLTDISTQIKALPEDERQTGSVVLDAFTAQCIRFKTMNISVPAVQKPPSDEYAQYGYDRSMHPSYLRIKAITNQIMKLQQDIDRCFASTKP